MNGANGLLSQSIVPQAGAARPFGNNPLYKPILAGFTPYDLAGMSQGLLNSARRGESTGLGILSGMNSFLTGRQQQAQDEHGKQLELERLGQMRERAEQQKLRTQAQQQELQSKQAQQKQLADLATRLSAGEIDREQAQIDHAGITGDYSSIFGGGTASPANVREYEYFSSLDPKKQSQYLRVKRANQMFDRGATQAFVDPQGRVVSEYQKTLAPEQMPETKFQQAQQAALGKVAAEKVAEASNIEGKTGRMIDTIDQLITPEGNLKEGVGSIVGGVGGFEGAVSEIMPITENQRKFQPYVDQLKGQSFMQAYQELKGGGQITEVEGKKAEQALGRLSQRQSDEDFASALKDLRDVISAGAERMKADEARLTGQQTQQTAPQAPRRKISFDALR